MLQKFRKTIRYFVYYPAEIIDIFLHIKLKYFIFLYILFSANMLI